MNIVFLVLLSAVCVSLLVAIPFLLKYLSSISYFLRKLSLDQDYYMCKFLKLLREMFIDDIE